MYEEILNLALELFKNVCVITVVAYLITRTKYFNQLLDRQFTWKNQAIMGLAFGAFSIFGTYSGIDVFGAIANVRDLGPMIAGLTCGPVVGIIAGLIGGIHRLTLGGFTCLACSSATIIAGIVGALIYVLNKGKFVGVVRAVLLMAGMELLHMALALILSQPFETAVAVVQIVIVPMVLTNSIGMAIFALFVSNLIKEKKTKAERDRYQKELLEKEIRIRELEIDKLKKYSTELETKLKRLEIKIDEERAQKSVTEITDTDYFRKLKEEASDIKKKRP